MAVQGIYAMLSDDKMSEDIIPAYLSHYAGMDIDNDTLEKPDQDTFQRIVEGVEEHKASLIGDIESAIGERQTPITAAREPLLYSILLCGVFEIKNRYDVDIPIIISDYLHVSHAFFEGNEPKLVNAVLDKLAKSLKPQS